MGFARTTFAAMLGLGAPHRRRLPCHAPTGKEDPDDSECSEEDEDEGDDALTTLDHTGHTETTLESLVRDGPCDILIVDEAHLGGASNKWVERLAADHLAPASCPCDAH